MASSMKLFFLLFLSLSFSFSRTQAREGRFFFNKTTRPADPTEATPTAEKIDGPTTLPPQSQNGYGLYGRGPEQSSPTTTTYSDDARRYNGNNNLPSNFPNTELANERYDEKNNYNDRYDNANNKFDTERGRRYGMSDTRFLDNGRYYYDVNAERYAYNGNDKWNARRGSNQKEYGVYDNQVGNKRGKYGDEAYGYGNSKEYDNGAMEYQNNQENQEEYVP
ncbi:protein E6-like [Ananas comosus]|uniref:Protein E6-like n=1 Tax=Ananas comosus TaxID=4615 RepID=A0A6P5FRS3_ANACO|nr:protein E6-like [Ananas comosus]